MMVNIPVHVRQACAALSLAFTPAVWFLYSLNKTTSHAVGGGALEKLTCVKVVNHLWMRRRAQ